MEKQDLEVLLAALDTALAKAFKGPEPLQVLVVGGACLLLQEVIERPTEDIDVIIFDMMGQEETSLIYDAPLANKIRRIIARVGKQHQVTHRQFFNDDCAPFLLELSGNELPAMRLLKAYKKLHLYIPVDLGYILACKLMAGRPNKDYTDIRALCTRLGIQTRTQAQQVVDRYFPSPTMQHYHDLPATMDALF